MNKLERRTISRAYEKNNRTIKYSKSEFEMLVKERKKNPENSEKFKQLFNQYQ